MLHRMFLYLPLIWNNYVLPMYVRPAIATCWDIDNDLGRNKCYTPKPGLHSRYLML